MRYQGVRACTSCQFKSLAEFIACAKARPGVLKYASYGAGSGPHLATELSQAKTGVRMVRVPYGGGGPAAIGAMSNRCRRCSRACCRCSASGAAKSSRRASSYCRTRRCDGSGAMEDAPETLQLMLRLRASAIKQVHRLS
jgi:tripartite-type tricarboxylate transporter receptor subunit TctC